MPKYNDIVTCTKTGRVGRFICKSDKFDNVYCVRTVNGYDFFEYAA